MFTAVARRAIGAVTRSGGRVFVFAHRRGYAAAVRCARCRALRVCPSCGSRPDPGASCSRCGAELGPCGECGHARFEALGAGVGRVVEELRRLAGPERVGPYPSNTPIDVGTERDLAGLAMYDLVVFTDLDGMMFGAHYRAAEEALRIGARLAGAVKPGSGHRLLVQTTEPHHPMVEALRKAEPLDALRAESSARAAFGYPPHGDLLVVEARGEADVDRITQDLSGCAGSGEVLGPAPHHAGTRWLIQGRSLTSFRRAIRPKVQTWRDSGATVRIDADPIDL